MISAVSGVNFKGEGAVSGADLINAPGKFSSAPASLDAPADSFESKGKEKKGHAGTVMGSIVGLLALAYVALGLAVGKGKLKKVEAPEGMMQKVQNFFHKIGESAEGLWNKVFKKKPEVPSEIEKPTDIAEAIV